MQVKGVLIVFRMYSCNDVKVGRHLELNFSKQGPKIFTVYCSLDLFFRGGTVEDYIIYFYRCAIVIFE